MKDPWQESAACRTEDPSLFFPEAPGTKFPVSEKRYAKAKAVCATCPVRTPCLAFALAHAERFGCWGGLSPEERKPMTDHCCPRCRAVIIRPLGRGGWRPRCTQPGCEAVAG